MKTLLQMLFVVALSILASACAFDADTPTPTPAQVVVATPGGCRSPKPTPPVEPKGSTVVVDYDAEGYASRIVVAGTDRWERFVGYMICTNEKPDARVADPDNDLLVTRIVAQTGTDAGLTMDNADVPLVGVSHYGEIRGLGRMPAGRTGKISIEINPPIRVRGCMPFQLVAKIANVMASSTVDGATTGVCRSGHAPALGLAQDPSDPTKLDIGIVSAKTRASLVASSAHVSRGRPMVIRKSEPIVTTLALASTTLANIDMPVFSFQIGADTAGSIGVKQIDLTFKKTVGLTLKGLHLRRNGSRVPPGTYDAIVYYGPKDIAGEIGADSVGGSIIIYFVDEEVVSGAGQIYTLEAVVTGAKPGQKFEIGFTKSMSTRSITGQLVLRDGFFGIRLADEAAYYSTFLWTDRSEVPHSDRIGSASADWINDVYVRDRTGAAMLSL